MKIFRFIGMALFAVFMCVNFASCSNEEVVPDEPTQEKYIAVGLDCVGEYLNVTDSPLSRAAGDDLYYIQVCSLEEVDNGSGTGATSTIEKPYAYGTFETSLNNLTIKLLEGKDYRFKVGIVVGASLGGDGVAITYDSEFNYSSSYSLSPADCIPVDFEGFYGELDKYTPVESGNVEISTKRVSYAAKFIAEGLTEGTLNIAVSKNEFNNLYSISLTPTVPENDKIYSFDDAWSAWQGILTTTGGYDSNTGEPLYEYKNYTSDKNLDINWTKDNGEVYPLGTYTITFKRNIRTTIRIKAEELSVSNGITVTREDTPISDDDNEYLIEGGQIITVPMNSSQI